jgi:hypothetical protein
MISRKTGAGMQAIVASVIARIPAELWLFIDGGELAEVPPGINVDQNTCCAVLNAMRSTHHFASSRSSADHLRIPQMNSSMSRRWLGQIGSAQRPTAIVTRASCVIGTTALFPMMELRHAPVATARFDDPIGYACVRGFCASADSAPAQRGSFRR